MSVTTLITGTYKGIGTRLCKHYIEKNHKVFSIARNEIDFTHSNLLHLKQDITHASCFKNISNLKNI